MKELEAISINEGAVLTEHGLQANGEVILIYSEPVYHSGGEEAVKRRHTNCLRLGMSPERMEQFAKNLQQAAVVMRKNFAAALSKTHAVQPQEEGRCTPVLNAVKPVTVTATLTTSRLIQTPLTSAIIACRRRII